MTHVQLPLSSHPVCPHDARSVRSVGFRDPVSFFLISSPSPPLFGITELFPGRCLVPTACMCSLWETLISQGRGWFCASGNGPSAIALSFMLSGHRPFYTGQSHPIEFLSAKLSEQQHASLLDQVSERRKNKKDQSGKTTVFFCCDLC